MGLLAEHADARAALAGDLARVGLVEAGGDAQQRRLAGAVRARRGRPIAERDRRVDRVEDDERRRPRGATPSRRRIDISALRDVPPRGHARRPSGALAGARAGASARRRPARPRRAAPDAPLPPLVEPASVRGRHRRRRSRSSAARRTAPAARFGSIRAGSRPRRPVRGGQPLAPRAEVRRARADDDPAHRSAAARARLAGALVDVQVLLHGAVALGRRVVVDRRCRGRSTASREDPADLAVQPALVAGPQRRRADRSGCSRARPERLVGVDVADAGEERLVEQQRLQAALRRRGSAARKRARRERRLERLRAEALEPFGPPSSPSRSPPRPVPRRQAHPPELADVAEPQLAPVLERQDECGCTGPP